MIFQLQAYEKKLELEKVIAPELKTKIGIDLFPDPEIKLFNLIEKLFKNKNSINDSPPHILKRAKNTWA